MEYLLLSTRPKLNQKAIVKVIEEKLKTVDRIIYIGSESVEGKPYFQKVKAFYDALTTVDILYVDFDRAYDEEILKSNDNTYCVHFATGNTYTFLKHIKSKNGVKILKDWCENAKLILATSAGNHLLSPDISYAQFGDINHQGIEDLKALNLLPFYFVPHFNKKEILKIEFRILINLIIDQSII